MLNMRVIQAVALQCNLGQSSGLPMAPMKTSAMSRPNSMSGSCLQGKSLREVTRDPFGAFKLKVFREPILNCGGYVLELF